MLIQPRKRKRTWLGTSALLVLAGFLPAQAASPNLPLLEKINPTPTVCGQVAPQDSATTVTRKGTCEIGGDCCYGFPEATCTRSGGNGGYESV